MQASRKGFWRCSVIARSVSDEAIQLLRRGRWIASLALAMTALAALQVVASSSLA
jgi:hypothetical protein